MPEQFKEYMVYGPYISKDDGRSRVILYKGRIKKTMSYPKFLWWKEKGELIGEDQNIHHKDKDFTNNSIENFEVVNLHDHMKNHLKPDAFSRTFDTFKCPTCSIEFSKALKEVRNNQQSKKRPGPFCSKRCAGRFNQRQQVQFRLPGIPNLRRKRPFKKLALKLYEIRTKDSQDGP